MIPARVDVAQKVLASAQRARSRSKETAGDPALNMEWVRAAGEFHVAAERQLYNTVEVARQSGCSWTYIGRALGVSAQAAQQRFSKPPRGRLF